MYRWCKMINHITPLSLLPLYFVSSRACLISLCTFILIYFYIWHSFYSLLSLFVCTNICPLNLFSGDQNILWSYFACKYRFWSCNYIWLVFVLLKQVKVLSIPPLTTYHDCLSSQFKTKMWINNQVPTKFLPWTSSPVVLGSLWITSLTSQVWLCSIQQRRHWKQTIFII